MVTVLIAKCGSWLVGHQQIPPLAQCTPPKTAVWQPRGSACWGTFLHRWIHSWIHPMFIRFIVKPHARGCGYGSEPNKQNHFPEPQDLTFSWRKQTVIYEHVIDVTIQPG